MRRQAGFGGLRERGRGLVRAAFAAALAALVLTSALFAGSAYLWCAPMRQAMARCCCAQVADPAQVTEPGQATVRFSCCDGRAIDALPEGTGGPSAPEVPPSAVLVEIPRAGAIEVPARRIEARAPALRLAARKNAIRSGPDRPSAICAELQVFRC